MSGFFILLFSKQNIRVIVRCDKLSLYPNIPQLQFRDSELFSTFECK
jgi:hypothetical protein